MTTETTATESQAEQFTARAEMDLEAAGWAENPDVRAHYYASAEIHSRLAVAYAVIENRSADLALVERALAVAEGAE